MNPTEVNVGRNFAVGQDSIEVLRPGLGDLEVPDPVEVLVLDGNLPAPPSLVGFPFDDVCHHVLPRPCGEFRIYGVEVNFSQAKIDARLTFGLVHRVHLLTGFGLVARLEADGVAGDSVVDVVSAPRPFEFSVTLWHIHFHVCKDMANRFSLASVQRACSRRARNG